MPLVDLTGAPLPNDDETADAGDVSLPIQAILAVVNGHIDTTNIEPGGLAWSVMGTLSKDIPGSAMEDDSNVKLYRDEANIQFVVSGLEWSALSGLNGAMSAGTFYSPTGTRIEVAAIATRAFNASKDTYASISPSGSISYQEVANNAAAPALGTNYQWLAKVVTNGSAITTVTSMRQTQPFGLGFIAGMSATQSVSNNTWTKLNMNTLNRLNGAMYETNLYRFTAPKDGYYSFIGAVPSATAYSNQYRHILAIWVNGSESRRLMDQALGGSGAAVISSGATTIYLTKGDYAELYMYQSVGGTYTYGSTDIKSAYFIANLIG